MFFNKLQFICIPFNTILGLVNAGNILGYFGAKLLITT